MLKTWMKILMWSGLSGGIGFFAGYHIGAISKKPEKTYDDGWNDGYTQRVSENYETYIDRLRKEYGGDFDGDHTDLLRPVTDEEDDAEMPEEEPVIPEPFEEEIPQDHPQYYIPERITEEDYYENKWGYEQDEMLYYEVDQVLVSKNTPTKPIKTKTEMDEVLGLAMIQNFYKADGEVLDAIFVKNDTMGVLFRVDRMDTAYDDPIDGDISPDYEEEEDFTKEDLDEDDE